MKKSLLALTVLSTMTMAGAANAAFSNDTLGQFNGTVDFKGRFIDAKTAVWGWQIPEALTLFAAKQDITKGEGTVDGNNTKYAVNDAGTTYPFLEGYMTTASKGGTGITPRVTIKGTEIAPGSQANISVEAFGDNGTKLTGMNLTFNLDTTRVLVKKTAAGVTSWEYDDAYTGINASTLADNALNLIQDNSIVPGFDMASGQGVPSSSITTTLQTAGTDDMVGGWYSQISNINLTGPTTEMNAFTTWSATIPVVISQI